MKKQFPHLHIKPMLFEILIEKTESNQSAPIKVIILTYEKHKDSCFTIRNRCAVDAAPDTRLGQYINISTRILSPQKAGHEITMEKESDRTQSDKYVTAVNSTWVR